MRLKSIPPPQIDRRAAAEGDREFLCTVYAETRREELEVTGWDDGQKDAFLRAQFALQDNHYRQHYPGASFEMILAGGVPAGRLYLFRTAREIRIMDIALLPVFRGRGIGGTIMGELARTADRDWLSLTLHVERNNPVLGYYERLGFRTKGEHGIYLFMERLPGQESGKVSSSIAEKNHHDGGKA